MAGNGICRRDEEFISKLVLYHVIPVGNWFRVPLS